MKAQDLKNSILQLAIQGKLVPQDASDEPAEVLYAKIQAEKQKLIKEGKIKKDKPLPPITDDEIPFEIPSTWKWVRLGDIILSNIGGGTPSKQILDYWNGNIPWATVKDLNCVHLIETIDKITTEGLINSSSNLIPKGNILICTRMGLGKIVFNDIDVAINQDLRGIILSEYIEKYYLFYYYKTLNIEGKGLTVKGVSVDILNKLLIPLPPLAEQHRIVAKVTELMQYCEELVHPEKRKNVEPITIEWLIDKGFDSCKQNGYTDVNAILDELNIAVMQDRNLKKGRIEYDNNKKKFQIWVNDLNDNWTKTHELVHYVNDNNEIKLYGAVGRKDETSLSKSKERNVDVLTAEILMPEDIFVSAVEQDNIGKYAFVDNAIVRKLSKQFRVSDDAVKIRLQNLGYHTK